MSTIDIDAALEELEQDVDRFCSQGNEFDRSLMGMELHHQLESIKYASRLLLPDEEAAVGERVQTLALRVIKEIFNA